MPKFKVVWNAIITYEQEIEVDDEIRLDDSLLDLNESEYCDTVYEMIDWTEVEE